MPLTQSESEKERKIESEQLLHHYQWSTLVVPRWKFTLKKWIICSPKVQQHERADTRHIHEYITDQLWYCACVNRRWKHLPIDVCLSFASFVCFVVFLGFFLLLLFLLLRFLQFHVCDVYFFRDIRFDFKQILQFQILAVTQTVSACWQCDGSNRWIVCRNRCQSQVNDRWREIQIFGSLLRWIQPRSAEFTIAWNSDCRWVWGKGSRLNGWLNDRLVSSRPNRWCCAVLSDAYQHRVPLGKFQIRWFATQLAHSVWTVAVPSGHWYEIRWGNRFPKELYYSHRAESKEEIPRIRG